MVTVNTDADVVTVDGCGASAGRMESGQHVYQRGFARSAAGEQDCDVAFVGVEMDVTELTPVLSVVSESVDPDSGVQIERLLFHRLTARLLRSFDVVYCSRSSSPIGNLYRIYSSYNFFFYFFKFFQFFLIFSIFFSIFFN